MCTTPPPTQHHSFYKNYPLYSNINNRCSNYLTAQQEGTLKGANFTKFVRNKKRLINNANILIEHICLNVHPKTLLGANVRDEQRNSLGGDYKSEASRNRANYFFNRGHPYETQLQRRLKNNYYLAWNFYFGLSKAITH